MNDRLNNLDKENTEIIDLFYKNNEVGKKKEI
jgi:hypothetical protein